MVEKTRFNQFTCRYRNQLLAVGIPLVLLPLQIFTGPAARCCYMIAVMSGYWLFHVFPLPVTSLLPVFMAPMFSIQPSLQVVSSYFSEVVIIFACSMMVNLALQNSGIHKRISLTLIHFIGTTPNLLLLNVMVSTWLLAVLATGPAAAALVTPLVSELCRQLEQLEQESAVVDEIRERRNRNSQTGIKRTLSFNLPTIPDSENTETNSDEFSFDNFQFPLDDSLVSPSNEAIRKKHSLFFDNLVLSVAYAANIGGMATHIGTPSNIILWKTKYWLNRHLEQDIEVEFINWIAYSLLISAILLVLTYIWMAVYSAKLRNIIIFTVSDPVEIRFERNINRFIENQKKNQLPISFAEVISAIMFVIMVYLTMARRFLTNDNWQSYFMPGTIGDSSPMVFIVFLLFLIPSSINNYDGRLRTLIDWKSLHTSFSWGFLFVIGGAFAIADISNACGLTRNLGEFVIAVMKGSPDVTSLSDVFYRYIIAALGVMIAVLNEVASNTAVSNIVVPISACLSMEFFRSPAYLTLATAALTSVSFMFPVSSPANAIAFSTGRITVNHMLVAGIVPTLLSITTVSTVTKYLAPLLFNFRSEVYENHVTSMALSKTCWQFLNVTMLNNPYAI